MILPINDEYRISSDRYQWMIQKPHKRNRNGEQVITWESESYFPTFKGALRELGERMVRESEAVGFARALEEVERVVTKLCAALPTHIQVTSTSTSKENGSVS